MGIDVSRTKYVTLNEGHHKRLVTCPDRNPAKQKLSNIFSYSIYRRTKEGDRRDGNPFIYALKQKNSYRIETKELLKFKPSFNVILNKILAELPCGVLVTMPSSYPIAEMLANRIARKSRTQVFSDIFRKATIAEVLMDFDIGRVKPQHLPLVKAQLATFSKLNGTQEVSFKLMQGSIRHYFNPIVLNEARIDSLQGGDLVLVDDLLSSGTTLNRAKDALNQRNIGVSGAICLLSAL